MAVFVLLLLVYCFIGAREPKYSAPPVEPSSDLAPIGEEDRPIPVDWELLPAVEQTAERH
jgi:hypothetical protein